MLHTCACRPVSDAQQHEQHAERELDRLSPYERPQAMAQLVQPAFTVDPRMQHLLPFQPAVERLPCEFHLVEFHGHAPIDSAPVICPRSFCLMRLILVATLVSLIPS